MSSVAPATKGYPKDIHACPTELLTVDLTGKVIIVTGGYSGIGYNVIKQLLSQKASIVIAGRNEAKGSATVENLKKETGVMEGIEFMLLDLVDFESVKAFVVAFKSKYSNTLDVLVNNAAVQLPKMQRTSSGKDVMMVTNHLGHVLLTELLLDTLKATSGSRIVHVSSVAASQMDNSQKYVADVDLSDPHWESKKFMEWECYGGTKFAQVLYSEELAKRLEGTGVKSVAIHPGWAPTPLFRNQSCIILCCIFPVCGPSMGILKIDAASQVHLFTILSPDIETGKFYSQKGIYMQKNLKAGAMPFTNESMEEFNPNNTAEKRAAVYEWSLKECGLQGGAPVGTVSDSGVETMTMTRTAPGGIPNDVEGGL